MGEALIRKVLRTCVRASPAGDPIWAPLPHQPDGQMAENLTPVHPSGGGQSGWEDPPPENDLVTMRAYETSARRL